METKNAQILEALKMQPLSEEEMTARHILGRLYGPIASCVKSTRNGRLYNKDLWEKALADDIFLEKVNTKSLFLELGHPADREETDMRQVCACIPEVPKIVGDNLCAYVDILDTPNGRLLKMLVDYGFIPGISSRGSGDVLDNNQVDPETFYLETFDIVATPANEVARLVCESVDSKNLRLKKALAESYKAAKEEDKNTMKQALENLNIDIKEELADDSEPVVEAASDFAIEWAPAGDPDLLYDHHTKAEPALLEDADTEEEAPVDVTGEDDTETDEVAASDEAVESEEPAPKADDANNDEETTDDASADEDTTADDAKPVDAEVNTVGDVVELLQEYDDDTAVEFEPIVIDGVEHEIDRISSFVDEEGILVLGVDCVGEPSADEDIKADAADEADQAEEVTDEAPEEPPVEDGEEDADTTAEDAGDVEVIESLKDMVRLKEALEAELNSLRKERAVGDAKVKDLQEKLNRYRTLLRNANDKVNEISALQSEVTLLKEQLTQSEKTITTLTEKVKTARQLNESAKADKVKITNLTEEVSELNAKSDALEAKLEGVTKRYTETLQERTAQAKSYKAKLIEAITRYIESKASMLGVQPSEITSRLNENYTLADVDAVCEQILDSTVAFSRLPFGSRTKASARISESLTKPTTADMFNDPDFGYDIDDSLLELAGLKK